MRTWRLHPEGTRRAQHLNPGSDHDSFEVRTVFGIVITNQILRRDPERRCLTALLRDPFVRRRSRHADVDDESRAELGHDAGDERPQEHVGDLEESQAQMSLAWLRRKVAHVWLRGGCGRTCRIYRWMVRFATVMFSFA